jgi:hypothetical protein
MKKPPKWGGNGGGFSWWFWNEKRALVPGALRLTVITNYHESKTVSSPKCAQKRMADARKMQPLFGQWQIRRGTSRRCHDIYAPRPARHAVKLAAVADHLAVSIEVRRQSGLPLWRIQPAFKFASAGRLAAVR